MAGRLRVWPIGALAAEEPPARPEWPERPHSHVASRPVQDHNALLAGERLGDDGRTPVIESDQWGARARARVAAIVVFAIVVDVGSVLSGPRCAVL